MVLHCWFLSEIILGSTITAVTCILQRNVELDNFLHQLFADSGMLPATGAGLDNINLGTSSLNCINLNKTKPGLIRLDG